MKIRRSRQGSRGITLTGPDEIRLLMCGSRDWSDKDAIRTHLRTFLRDLGVKSLNKVAVVEGEADGADTLSREVCQELGIACFGCPAPWTFYERQGKRRAAGPVRNGWMLKWFMPNAVLAFHPYLPGSRGTKNMVMQARTLGVKHIRVVAK